MFCRKKGADKLLLTKSFVLLFSWYNIWDLGWFGQFRVDEFLVINVSKISNIYFRLLIYIYFSIVIIEKAHCRTYINDFESGTLWKNDPCHWQHLKSHTKTGENGVRRVYYSCNSNNFVVTVPSCRIAVQQNFEILKVIKSQKHCF